MHPFWTKLMAKYTEGIFALCLGWGRGAEKALVEVELLSSPCGEGQAMNCLGETGSKLKLTVSLRERLISHSQA
jgi:hypothetical protein